MSNLFGIKKKINSINKINKITESMKIVAISKINKLKRQFLNNTEYQQQLFEVLSDIPHDFLIPKTANKKLWIVFTSTLGMAGPYNVNVFKKVNELVKPTDKVIVFGIKGEKLFKAKNTNFLRHFEIYEKDLLFFSFRYAATYIKKLFNTGKFNSIEYIYTTHTTSLNVKNVQILPFPNKTKTTSSPFLFEPNQDAILDNTLKFYIESTLYSAFLESKLCEQISRKTSMSHANDNISDMLSQLSITYNKKRQEKITQEVTH